MTKKLTDHEIDVILLERLLQLCEQFPDAPIEELAAHLQASFGHDSQYIKRAIYHLVVGFEEEIDDPEERVRIGAAAYARLGGRIPQLRRIK
jgi:hypothetical protein